MRRLSCPACGARVYFENYGCLGCGAQIAFDPERGGMAQLAEAACACANRAQVACNWATRAGEPLWPAMLRGIG